MYGSSERFDGKCFRQAWYAFQQDVPVSEQAYQQAFYHVFLTHYGFVKLHSKQINKSTALMNALI